MADRTFTLQEAQNLLPVLESLLRTAMDGKKLIEAVDNELQELAHRVLMSGGLLVNVVQMARRKAEREKAIHRVKDTLAEINAIGVQVKDIEIGLLDFPCKVEGRVVLLCWKLGEQGITHWHTSSEGFAGRKPVDERIAKAKKAN
ncbi:MAG: DUF2203 domain-containing protein [Acidobacteria bacterium]|nr:MAG: hypothetical protein AUI85_02250 [Acidobacteriales bacterium 13_1_40CM_3_55_5]PYX01946.1 MAG: DUF2203 domain-containing protein [Acidobacteriota bacterium]PYX06833.1 MAG: DUF2203 domain-containing protein [Acidobacteriota bacterium]PYX15758.1 MAG: DUF2203 domain-containing protein [Acidobacteriota bacterium]